MRYLLVDILELTDRYVQRAQDHRRRVLRAAYRVAANRLGLGDWQRLLDAKIQTVNEMYRFSADDAQNARAQFLELIVIILIGVEIVIGLLTLARGIL